VDIHLHDTYFVVSHFHFVLFGGSVFAIYAGIYHWWPKITGRMLNHRWGVIHFVVTYLSFFFTFFPQHLAGMQGMPRRVAEYAPEFQVLNVIISLSAFVLGLSTFIIITNMLWSIFRGPIAGSNPWRAITLEWQTTSPPPPYNFKGSPVPFEDPYGYASEAGSAYMDAMAERLTPGPQLRAGKGPAPSLPAAPEPVSGD
jgi:cytochrome c oxidase subunit I